MKNQTLTFLLAALGAGSAMLASCSYERTPERKIETTTHYDTASKRLTLRCVTASDGTCHLLLANGAERRALDLAVGSTRTFDDVDPAARTCALAPGLTPASCNWVSVHETA